MNPLTAYYFIIVSNGTECSNAAQSICAILPREAPYPGSGIPITRWDESHSGSAESIKDFRNDCICALSLDMDYSHILRKYGHSHSGRIFDDSVAAPNPGSLPRLQSQVLQNAGFCFVLTFIENQDKPFPILHQNQHKII